MIVSKDFYVGFRMIDEALKMKSGDILNLFVDIAGVHSEKAGDGFGKSDSRWILIGYKVKVFDKPSYGEDVTFTTWSRDYSPALATREFEVRDSSGKLLIVALANFVKYNIKTHKLEKIRNELMNAYESEPERSNFGGVRLGRFVEPDEYDGKDELVADWRWMDLNRHMNNSHYVDIAEHVLKKNYGIDTATFDFEVYYKREIPEDTKVCAYFKETEKFFVVAIKSADGKTLHGGVTFIKQ